MTAPRHAQGEGWFWPDQAFRDLLVCLVVFGIMLSLVLFGGQGNKIESQPDVNAGEPPALYEKWAQAGREGLGANLDASADRLTQGYPARPEWYFLFLFQLLKYFEGPNILVGTFIIPNAVMAGLFLLPLFGYGRMRKFGHFLGIMYVVALLAGIAMLTLAALAADSPEPWPMNLGGGTENAKSHYARTIKAEWEAKRAVQLAAEGIPEEGGRELLRRDPLTKGPALFASNCAGCHRYSGLDDGELNKVLNNPDGKYKASDLAGFATKKWIRGLLENPSDDRYFGKTNLGGMKRWRQKEIERPREKWRKADPEKAKQQIAAQDAAFDTIAEWLAQQAFPPAKRNQELEKTGRLAFDSNCSTCHSLGGEAPKEGPDLTGYGSQEWLRLMLMAPSCEARYPQTNAMPAFRLPDGTGAEIHKLEMEEIDRLRTKLVQKTDPDAKDIKTPVMPLSDVDRELIIRWLTRDYRVVFGGQAIAAAQKR